MRIHCLQHVPFEGPGCIETWAFEKGHSLSYTKFYEPHSLPEMQSFDCLIILGGHMGVHDEAQHRWLKAEKDFIEKTIIYQKKILGICLGAQLIALVLGARVTKNLEKEIGWYPVKKEASNTEILNGISSEIVVFHWHGDTFGIPANAIRLFSSEACQNQGFSFGKKVVGLQFHLEVTEDNLQQMIAAGEGELSPGKYIQSTEQILGNVSLIENNKIMFQLLDNMETI